MGPITVLDDLGRRQISCLCQELPYDYSVFGLWPTYDPGSLCVCKQVQNLCVLGSKSAAASHLLNVT
jgi:hypothetical protein